MTPADAAEILGVAPTASAEEIEAAFRKRARRSHPDVFAGQSEDTIRAASAEFSRVAEAHALLLARLARAAAAVPWTPPPINRWLFVTWVSLLAVATALSFIMGPFPGSFLDLVLRMLPLSAALVGFALTGDRRLFLTAAVLSVTSVIVTLFTASFGSLLAFEVLIVPVIGLWYMGRSRIEPARRTR